MEGVQLTHVSKGFTDARHAVHDLSFTLEPGAFGVLVGPSGAGKTTVLNMIAGLVMPDEGDVLIGGNSTAGIAPENRDVAMVFENYALYPHKTVRKNLEFPLHAPRRAKELSQDEVSRRVSDVAATLGIDHLLDRLPSQLSGGQRQRVSLGRALVRRPRVLLLDEPITHLDAKLRHEMRTELKRIQRDLGITTLYATPDQGDALALADMAVVLHDGQAWQIDSPDEVYHRPRHLRVAEIIGDPRMNILSGEVSNGAVEVLGCRLEHSGDIGGDADRQVLVGFRPHEAELVPEEVPGSVPARVSLRQPLGHSDVLYVDVAGTVVRVLSAPGMYGTTGASVWLRLPADKVHVFDAETGITLTGRKAA